MYVPALGFQFQASASTEGGGTVTTSGGAIPEKQVHTKCPAGTMQTASGCAHCDPPEVKVAAEACRKNPSARSDCHVMLYHAQHPTCPGAAAPIMFVPMTVKTPSAAPYQIGPVTVVAAPRSTVPATSEADIARRKMLLWGLLAVGGATAVVVYLRRKG